MKVYDYGLHLNDYLIAEGTTTPRFYNYNRRGIYSPGESSDVARIACRETTLDSKSNVILRQQRVVFSMLIRPMDYINHQTIWTI